ncbi:MAG: ferredoxin:thioredoxin reductase [Candidatus Aenigmarchaeota archaeon]|nr:ferredoxin:thioredoxin reductase [Candidatus Aenigmarchaeota archaeon]NIQ18069.1 ferredoxin:thioredoxin reductase [Candidatus Aenigmarchaeota archaeon]
MNKEDIRRIWERFAENKDFMLNPDEKHVDMLADGVLANEKKFGLKLCPCRLRDGTRETDLSLICPCNFKTQEVWAKEGRCWCGLFIKRSHDKR